MKSSIEVKWKVMKKGRKEKGRNWEITTVNEIIGWLAVSHCGFLLTVSIPLYAWMRINQFAIGICKPIQTPLDQWKMGIQSGQIMSLHFERLAEASGCIPVHTPFAIKERKKNHIDKWWSSSLFSLTLLEWFPVYPEVTIWWSVKRYLSP